MIPHVSCAVHYSLRALNNFQFSKLRQKWAKYAKKYCFRSLKSTVLLMWSIWQLRSAVYMETCEPILNSFESIWPSMIMSFHFVTNTKLKKLFPVCQHAFSQTRQHTQLMRQWFIMDHHTLPIMVTHMPNVWSMFWTRVTTNNMAARYGIFSDHLIFSDYWKFETFVVDSPKIWYYDHFP